MAGYDLAVYLLSSYFFLLALLIQYRNLCHEWANWMQRIPVVSENEILDWYRARSQESEVSLVSDGEGAKDEGKISREVFLQAVHDFENNKFNTMFSRNDPLLAKVAKGLPFAFWMLKKEDDTAPLPRPFSAPWFPQLKNSVGRHQQLVRGLKEHSIFVLFRIGRDEVSSLRSINPMTLELDVRVTLR